MCKRPAPWKARWLKLQGGRASATAGLPAMAPTVKRGSRLPILSAQTAKVVFPGQAACSARLPKIAVSAGAERQRVWGGKPPRHGCRVGTRVAVAPCGRQLARRTARVLRELQGERRLTAGTADRCRRASRRTGSGDNAPGRDDGSGG